LGIQTALEEKERKDDDAGNGIRNVMQGNMRKEEENAIQ
jgi:hypothetical protein